MVAPTAEPDERKEQIALQKTVEAFGCCPNLHHLGLYMLNTDERRDRMANLGFPQLQKIRWRSLKRFEYSVCPKGVVCNQFGEHQKPWKASEYATISPNEFPLEVVLFFNKFATVVNPSAFVAAMAEVFPTDSKVEGRLERDYPERGLDAEDYEVHHSTQAFVTWAREIWKRIVQERMGEPAASQSDESDFGSLRHTNRNGYYE